jgi:hypothetical protein
LLTNFKKQQTSIRELEAKKVKNENRQASVLLEI